MACAVMYYYKYVYLERLERLKVDMNSWEVFKEGDNFIKIQGTPDDDTFTSICSGEEEPRKRSRKEVHDWFMQHNLSIPLRFIE